jgi:hypothetical protein
MKAGIAAKQNLNKSPTMDQKGIWMSVTTTVPSKS